MSQIITLLTKILLEVQAVRRAVEKGTKCSWCGDYLSECGGEH